RVKNNRLLGELMNLLRLVQETDDITEALNNALEMIVSVLKCEEGAIWLLAKDTNLLVPLCHIGPVSFTNITVENGLGVEGTVTRSGKTLLIRDTLTEDYPGSVLDDCGPQVRNMPCVPVKSLGQTLGCIQIANKADGSSYDEEEVQLCERIAALAAITMEEKGFAVSVGEKKDVLITLRNVIKEFPSGDGVIRVLKGINLELYKNEFVVILGESGCGKSTLVNIIGGMDQLTDGSLMIDGKDFSRPTDAELTKFRREYMGFVFQQYNLMPNLTAQENVQFIADLVKDPMPAAEAIAKVGLTDRADNFPAALSGGQQQRVSIARAIVKKPKIIFADEPTAALDYQTSIEVLSVFEQIVQSRGATVVMITHNPEIARMANRVVKLRNGMIASIRVNLHPAAAKDLVW
ncbi:MAG: ATP-binding cassette domain-containing protein, partial [Oscillospiraceae bacterium]|nr:ATP-binding cassette domain-containing protein [Oscillospiraceae bacterium]